MRLLQLNFLTRVRDAILWRAHHWLGDRVVYGVLLACARLWRHLLARPVWIGVVGSAGKTTAKELLLVMLAGHGKAVGNPESYNNIEEIAMAMLRVRPWHRFFATELNENMPGVVGRKVVLLQPRVGIITVVEDDHLAAFGSHEALAREMSRLVTALPASGTAVLNADDDRVLAMAALCKGKVLTYGTSTKAELRAQDITSNWPQRLRMTVTLGAEKVQLQTQLCGTHWVPSVLGAIGGGLAAGLTLQQCATGIATALPFEGRMQPVTTPQGVTFIRDDFKSPLWTLDACFDFMRSAAAKRKIIAASHK